MARRVPEGVTLFIGVILLLSFTGSRVQAAPNRCEAGLFDTFCEAGKAASEKADDIITAPIEIATGGAVDMITAWVADGAQWILGKVVNFIDDSTSPDLTSAWFEERYDFMIGLGALVLVPILLLSAIRAILNQDVGQLLRSFFLYLPLAILTTFVAVVITQVLLDVTDALSAAVADGVAGDVSEIFDDVTKTLDTGQPGAPPVPSFAVFFGSLLLVVGAFFVWIELLIRSAAVTVSVFLLPLMLAGLVWPATSRWARRLVETLFALILSKFVIVAIISLATAALAEPGDGGFGTLMGGAALMLMAAFSPMALLKLIPIAESTAAGHLEGIGRKPTQAIGPGGSVHETVSMMRKKADGRGPGTLAMAGSAGQGAAAGSVVATGAIAAARAGGKAATKPGRALSDKVDATDSSSREASGGGLEQGRSVVDVERGNDV